MIPFSSPKCVPFQKIYRFLFFDATFFAALSSCFSCILSLSPGSCRCFPEWYPLFRRFYFMIPLITPDFSILTTWCRILRHFSRFNPWLPLINDVFSASLSHRFSKNDSTFFARPGPFSRISLCPASFDASFIAHSHPKKFSKKFF